MSEVGGILGLGYSPSNFNGMWTNSTISSQQFSLSLYPNQSDYSWFDLYSEQKWPESQIGFGVFNQSFTHGVDTITLTASTSYTNNWQTALSSIKIESQLGQLDFSFNGWASATPASFYF